MKILTPSLFIIALSLLMACDPAHDADANLKKQIYDFVNDKQIAPTEIAGLQMVLVKNGAVVFEHAEGIATLSEHGNTPLLINHKVRIASISKFIMTMAFMSLIDQGKVDLDLPDQMI